MRTILDIVNEDIKNPKLSDIIKDIEAWPDKDMEVNIENADTKKKYTVQSLISDLHVTIDYIGDVNYKEITKPGFKNFVETQIISKD